MKNDVNVTQMNWMPALIRLTQPANEEVNNGQPTPLFIEAGHIVVIQRLKASFFRQHDDPEQHAKGQHHLPGKPFECTSVLLHGYNGGVLVEESCEEVARLRDEALGHSKEPGKEPNGAGPLRAVK